MYLVRNVLGSLNNKGERSTEPSSFIQVSISRKIVLIVKVAFEVTQSCRADFEVSPIRDPGFVCSAWWYKAEMQFADVRFQEASQVDSTDANRTGSPHKYISFSCSTSHCTAQQRTLHRTGVISRQYAK